MIAGIHHVDLTTRDLDRLTGFYRDRFGGKVVREFFWSGGETDLNLRLGLDDSAARIALMRFGSACCIEFFEFLEPKAPTLEALRSVARLGYSHVCFAVEDCEVEYRQLVAAEVRFHAPPLAMPGGGKFAYARDPDANIIEILQAPSGSGRNHEAAP